MLTIQQLSYIHPNKDLLFHGIDLNVNTQEKIALIGNNGVGKSTLLKIIAQQLQASSGTFNLNADTYYVPQIYGQFNELSIAQALQVDDKLNALQAILNGDTSETHFTTLNDDWTIEERCKEALKYWQLSELDLNQKMETLSGGQKTKVLLTGMLIHHADLILLDEPSNHLDAAGRQLLYDFILSCKSALIVISHDRKLLNLIDMVCELNKNGIKIYGGNYDFYREQKEIENNALDQDIQSKEKALKKAKEKERETRERQQKLDSRGKGKQEKSGVPKIMMNTLRNSAENSTAKLKGVHAEKIGNIKQELQGLRSLQSEIDQMKFGFDASSLHKGKQLFKANQINCHFGNGRQLWHKNLSTNIVSGDRLVIKGGNGAGKTTLINIILGKVATTEGEVMLAQNKTVYIDQDYSLIDNRLSVYEQAQTFNAAALQEHEIKIRLNRFLFGKSEWDKLCAALSGGERMRLLLCCLNIGQQAPDIIILDEPTNNLDIQNIEILTHAINDYQGTLIVVSHDETFLQQVNIQKTIDLE